MNKPTVDMSKPIRVPREIAVCPACSVPLYLEVEEWSRCDDGSWMIKSFTLECANMPSFQGGKKWMLWESSHRQTFEMPYVYWLPLEELVADWLKTVEIVNSNDDRRRLQKWIASCGESAHV